MRVGGSWREQVVEERFGGVARPEVGRLGNGRLRRNAVEQFLDLRRQRDLRLGDVALAGQRWRLRLTPAASSAQVAPIVGVGSRGIADPGALTRERLLVVAQVLPVVDK